MRVQQSRRHGRNPRPAWCALYVIAVLLVAVVGLVEMHVGGEGLRKVLEVLTVVAGIGLIAVWLRSNRIALELERGRRRT
jgi:hypothetical protein